LAVAAKTASRLEKPLRQFGAIWQSGALPRLIAKKLYQFSLNRFLYSGNSSLILK
jgi:hypothetical protein